MTCALQDLLIRAARSDDLAALDQAFGQRELFLDRLRRQADDLGELLVAWNGSQVIGVVFLWLAEAEEAEIRDQLPGVPLLTDLQVRHTHRGLGVGTQLVEEAERALRLKDRHQVALAVEETNDLAAKLYVRLGYRDWKHALIVCHSFPDDHGARLPEKCRVLVKTL